MSKRNTQKIYEFIANYKSVTHKEIYKLFSYINKTEIEKCLNVLQRDKLIEKRVEVNSKLKRKECRYTHKLFNSNKDTYIYGNSPAAIHNCLAALIKLNNYYNIGFHRLCYYPSTIKLSIFLDDEEHFYEICYVPYSNDNSELKRIGFYFDKQADEEYDVQRIVVCDNRWQINNDVDNIKKHIPNINSFALITSTDDAVFFSAKEENEDD